MVSEKIPVTTAIRMLRANKIQYTEHLYDYEERGGTAVSARELGVPERIVIKTLIMENEKKQPMVVLMHGDCEVSTKNLARIIACKTINPCAPEIANKHSGFVVGGTSPFGTKKIMPVYMQASIAELEKIYINGGRRGFLVGMSPAACIQVLKPILVDVAIYPT
ncbi:MULTISPECIES: Cys-tRNA(Pro) deacylase [Deefgea]|uniref:Cys-tRNA(Pro)/Cys-tRNA(Cys) deacylase n=1 Tax=Deefgea chitinilytica TaxID=570276 RepID=A0ABS2C9P6_9NEIS|nr:MULTISPECIES: Cys-tRNA(Pro) deacylase [Deefgea]MBM5570854.1 Cys-tRNA(Pro) deacylase [Deefgea chitinilytica]MBM9888083.1 Cys-tRNA(Pro) deacylase [Deefgea sp. CFH1-16]